MSAIKIKKLEALVKEWEIKAEDLRVKSTFCRDHNFLIEAQIIGQKKDIIEEMCRAIRLKVIKELI